MKKTKELLAIILLAFLMIILLISGFPKISELTLAEEASASDPIIVDGEYVSVSINAESHATTTEEAYYIWKSTPLEITLTVNNFYPEDNDDDPEELYGVCVAFYDYSSERYVSPLCENTYKEKNLEEENTREFNWRLDLSNKNTPKKLGFWADVDGVDCGAIGLDCDSARNVENITFPIKLISKSGDVDNDGLQNEKEVNIGTGISNADTDADGLEDGSEVNEYETDPINKDTDDDGLEDGEETEQGLDPKNSDTDGDGLKDGSEVNEYMTDPDNTDSDSDGLEDRTEINQYNTDPTEADSDNDGLNDGAETGLHETNPNQADSDGDGLNDGTEVNDKKSDPNDPDDPSEPTDTKNRNQAENEGSKEPTTTTQQNKVQTKDGGSTEKERGFFTNNPNSSFPGLNGPMITTVGFILSVIGILLEMRGG